MSGFVASPPAPPPGNADVVAGDGWWPDLSIAAFRDTIRVGTAVTDPRVRAALIGGMVSADRELATWRATAAAAGATKLADVPGPAIGTEKRALVLWRRAVHGYAAADLVETHSEISATNDGRARLEERALSAADHLRNATLAVRDLLGRGRSQVRLL